ncbi:DEAD-domain-containing protein [Phlebopus sp. FC_14]|nr:DEAD-domain-containing protein [Phlebopus sp. FC_14]
MSKDVVQPEIRNAQEKSKKPKKQKRIKDPSKDQDQSIEDKAEKKKRREGEKKNDKKKKSKEPKEDTAGGGGGEDTVSTVIDSQSDKPSKKDRKRKRDTDAVTGVPIRHEPDAPKKKKKRQEQTSTSSPESGSAPPLAPSYATSEDRITNPASSLCTPDEAASFLEKHCITIHTPNGTDPVVPVISFDQFNVPAGLRDAFKDFKEPTPIQACTWPPALDGRDVVGVAETGSGKTLAFGIPALVRLISSPVKAKKSGPVAVLVVAPTRELAVQTHETLSALGAPFGIASVAVFGGVDKAPQIKALASSSKNGSSTRIVVGTPGRILDLVNEGVCDLSKVNYLVLDEADRMLDKGFENDIRTIIRHTLQGSERQTMMFSATWPEAVRRLASSFQTNPVRVTVGSDDLTANSRVKQTVEVFDDPREKEYVDRSHFTHDYRTAYLLSFLLYTISSRLFKCLKSFNTKSSVNGSSETRILVFALYKKEASRVESTLRRAGYEVGALHGDMSQSARMDALEKFRTGETRLLVATDVAARGLDIPDVGAVINYTFPLTIEDYIHRIGRTGRGGRTGKSFTFFTGENHERALAGELARVLRESGFDEMADRLKTFPMTIKKKTHSAYGAFFRDDITAAPTKIVF